MDENNTLTNQPEFDGIENVEDELTHTEKLSGMLSAPSQIFSEMSRHKPKVIDWFMPVLVLVIVSALSTIVMMSVPEVKNKMMEKQMEHITKSFESAIENGSMTEEEAEAQFDTIAEKMQNSSMGLGLLFQIIGIVFGIFIVFFIISLFFFILARFIFKDQGSYSTALVAYGLPAYISAFQVIAITLISVLSNDLITDTSLRTLLGADNLTINGFFMSIIDPLKIWYYFIISIAFAKMFRSESTTKYFAVIFGLWIGFGLFIVLLAKQVPWLGSFIM